FAGVYLAVETALNSFLEPILYGRTTGVTALGLLIAALFWTWLWGIPGLLLSTPMTVCLAVLGKYVKSLEFLSILRGEEAEVATEVRLYQRLLALDPDEAHRIIEEELRLRPRAEVFDQVLIPTLSHVERDFTRGEIEEREQRFAWRFVDDVLD